MKYTNIFDLKGINNEALTLSFPKEWRLYAQCPKIYITFVLCDEFRYLQNRKGYELPKSCTAQKDYE